VDEASGMIHQAIDLPFGATMQEMRIVPEVNAAADRTSAPKPLELVSHLMNKVAVRDHVVIQNRDDLSAGMCNAGISRERVASSFLQNVLRAGWEFRNECIDHGARVVSRVVVDDNNLDM
jgi:hypothetical protein